MKQKFTYKTWAGICLFLVMLGQKAVAQFPKYLPQYPVVTGSGGIKTLAKKGNVIYLGGDFTGLGKKALSFGYAYDQIGNATPNSAFAAPDNAVTAATPDGAGGFYIFGGYNYNVDPVAFSNVGGVPRNGMARINTDGSLNDWGAGLNLINNFGNPIEAAVKVGNVVVVGVDNGGSFGISALDAATGQPASGWDDLGIPLAFTRKLILNDNKLYILGLNNSDFNQDLLAVIDVTDANHPNLISSFKVDAKASNGTNLTISDMVVSDNAIYLSAYQYISNSNLNYQNQTLSGQSFNSSLFAINATTGAFIKSYTTSATSSNLVSAVAVDGNKLYMNYHSGVNSKLTAYDLQTGADLSAELPVFTMNASVAPGLAPAWPYTNYNKLTITADHKLIIYGGFDKINNNAQTIAAIDLTSNALVDWHPVTTVIDNADKSYIGPSVAVESSGKIYIGGYINNASATVTRKGLAAMNASTGDILPWTPADFIGTINSVVVSNSTLYVGGSFNGTKNNLAAYDISDPNNPALIAGYMPNPNASVNALVVKDNSLYVGGNFQNIAGTARNYLASFDISGGNGALTAWNPSPDDKVNAFSILNNTLYAGGAFLNVGATAHKLVAAFDLNASGTLTNWDPKLASSFTNGLIVNTLATQTADGANHDARVFIGGGVFNKAGSNSEAIPEGFTVVNITDGALDPWKLTLGFGATHNKVINALNISGNTLYVGGVNFFNSADISGNFSQIDANNYLVGSPYTNFGFDNSVNTILPSGNLLFVGGDFGGADHPARSDAQLIGFAAFQTGNITPVITFADQTNTYGDAPFAPAATSTVADNPITYTIAAGDNNDNVISLGADGKITILKPGIAMITASQTGAADVKAKITVTKKALLVKANDATKIFSDANPAFTTTITGYIADNDTEKGKVTGAATVKLSDPANAGADPGATPAVGAYDLVVDTTAMHSDYYSFTQTNGHFTVTKSLQTITIAGVPATVTYGDAAATLTVSSTSTSDLAVSSSDPNVATVTKDATDHYVLNAKGAGTATITFSQAADGNHEAGTVDQSIIIAKKPLDSVVMDDKTILTGQSLPEFTIQVSGFVNGDNLTTAISPAPVFSTTAANTNTAGEYDINIDNYSSLTSANYILPTNYTKGKLTIGSLSFNNITKTYGDAPFIPGATASTGGTPTYTFSNPAIAGYDAGTGLVTIKTAGSTNITATLNGSSVTRTLTVSPKQVTVSADNASRIYGIVNPVFNITYNGFITGEDQTNITPFTPAVATTTAIAASDAGNYNITLSGASATNYTFVYTTGAILTVNKAPLTITADNQTKVYGQANPVLAITYAGFVNNDDATKLTTQAAASTTAIASSAVGSYPINLTTAVATNYTITQNNGTLTVTPAPLTVTADNFTRDRGKANPDFTITYSGFASGDSAASLTTPATATSTAVPNSPAGSYPIIPAGAVSGNYTFTYVNGVLTVNGNQLLTYNPFSVMTYGDADFNPGATSDQGGTPTYITSNPSVATIIGGKVHINGAGTADITATFPAAGGYNISTDKQTLTVQKKNLSIAADNKTRNYGDPNPALTVTYTGLVNSDTYLSLTVQPQVTTTATATSPAGIYPITVSGAASDNYNISYAGANLTISNLTRALTFNAIPAKTYGNGDFSPASLNSGEQPVYTSSNPTVATVVNGVIHIVGAGTSDITASAPVNSNYNNVNPVTQTLTVNKSPLTITADNKTKSQGPPDILLTATYSGFVGTDNQLSLTTRPILTTTAKADSPTGTYPINISSASSQNYDITYVNGTLNIIFGVGQNQIVVHPMLSPNGDGKNDYLLIDGIQNYPDNHVLVVNRNGAKVYEAKGYDNSSIVFSGKSNDGNSLVAGTYYYEINYTLKGNTQRKTGYVIIKY